GRGQGATIRPLTDQDRLEHEVAELHDELDLVRKLTEASRLASEDDPVAGTLQRITQLAEASVPSVFVRIDRGEAEQDGPGVEAAKPRRTVRAAIDEIMQRWPALGAACSALGVVMVLAFPMANADESLGALNAYFTDTPDAVAEQRLGLIADHATTAVA